jgi:hypothetical protein
MPDLEKLKSAIDAAEASAYGSDETSDLSRDRALAIDYYHGRNVEPAPEGRSQVVDRSVFETIQWILPSLCRIFANGDNIVAFSPLGEEDEQAAEQEADYLNYVVTQRNPWFQTFMTWAQDALLSKNGYCLAYVEERIKTETESYEDQSDEAVTFLTQDEGVEVVAFQSRPDPSGEMQPVMGPDGQPAMQFTGQLDPMGNPVMMPLTQPKMLHSLTLRQSKPEKRLAFKVLPPERCKVDQNTPSYSLEGCDYFEFFDYVTISYLRSLGFDVPDDIATDEQADLSEDDARDLYSETFTKGNDSRQAIDPSMKRVKARMVWIRHDYDEDGIAELQLVICVGSEILRKAGEPYIYPCSRIPVASITPMPNTHRHMGTSEADVVADIQRIKTAVLRQGLDSLYLANNPRHIVSNQVNLDDMQVSRPGGLVRMIENSVAIPGEGHVMPVVTPFVFPQAIAGMEYMDQMRESRTGASRAFTGVDPSAVTGSNKSSGVAINQLSTMASQRIEQIARVFASGIEYLFSVAHELILKGGHQKETLKLRGKWVTVDPSTWKTGRDMRIVVGYGAGNKDALVARLVTILQAQKEAMSGGLRVANEQNVYEALIELTKASDFSAPGRFWTDPSTLPQPQPQPSEAQIYAQVEQGKAQSGERIKAAELQSNEKVKAAEIQQRSWEAQLKAEVSIITEQMKQGGSVDIETIRAHLRDAPIRVETQKLDDAKSILDKIALDHGPQMAALGNALKDAIDAMSAPREIVRDKGGKAVGVRVMRKKAANDRA